MNARPLSCHGGALARLFPLTGLAALLAAALGCQDQPAGPAPPPAAPAPRENPLAAPVEVDGRRPTIPPEPVLTVEDPGGAFELRLRGAGWRAWRGAEAAKRYPGAAVVVEGPDDCHGAAVVEAVPGGLPTDELEARARASLAALGPKARLIWFDKVGYFERVCFRWVAVGPPPEGTEGSGGGLVRYQHSTVQDHGRLYRVVAWSSALPVLARACHDRVTAAFSAR